MSECCSMLLKARSEESLVKALRVLDPVIGQTVDHLLLKYREENLIHILAMIVQYTDKVNFSVLTYLTGISDYTQVLASDVKRGLETVFRLFEAQPYLLKVWDCSFLFSEQIDQQLKSNETLYLLRYLRHIVVPSNQPLRTDLEKTKNIESLEYLQSLRLNKAEEALKQPYFDNLFPSPRPSILQTCQQSKTSLHKGRVLTSYLKGKIDQVLEVMEQNIFSHFALSGDEGSGKMSFIELLSDRFHEASSSNKLIVVTLEETFDSKNLVGTYVCNESGEFIFKKGPLTVAAEQGLWLVLRHIEKAPSDLLTFLLPLVQENILQVTANMTIIPKLGFRIFALCHSTSKPTEDIKPFMNHLTNVALEKLMDLGSTCFQREDFESEILPQLFPMTFLISWLPKILLDSVREYLNPKLNTLKGQLLDFKALSVRQIFRIFSRTESYLKVTYKITDLSDPEFYFSSNSKMHILEDLIDIYLGYLYDKSLKHQLIQELVTNIWNNHHSEEKSAQANLDPSSVADQVIHNTRSFGVNTHSCYFGRSQNMQRDEEIIDEEMKDQEETTRKFVYTATTLRLMEQIAQSINQSESSLLVGETGTGKTTSVQELAKLLNKKLHVFNMNQNTDSSDLLGGFKPVDLKFLLKPLYESFLSLFKSEFKNLEKNKKFLDLTQKCYEENRVKEFLQCLNHGLSAVRGKKNFSNHSQLNHIESQAMEVSKRANKLESGGGFIFQFIEGTLIKSIKEGEWILLDEINLASESVLNRLATLIDGDYILLNERADIVETQRHKDFRLFLCMNPPYTSAGKKQLPWSLRSKLTEIYVPELDNQSDLWMIIDKNCSNQVNEPNKRKILEFYIKVRDQVMKQTKRGNIGLRNLSRSLSFMKSAINLKYPILKAIYDSLYTCFASHLDQTLQDFVSKSILYLFDIRQMPQLAHASELALSEKYVIVEQFIIPKGMHQNVIFDTKDFVTTKSFKKLLKQLAGVVAVSDYAVILQGPTSAGKTSTVQYLANITNNKVLRINNHMHTDIQEYLGSYVPDREGGGKLVFQEGVLVEAVRNGYWVILDELNLAPSEVLEALNRLLDDNRELLIVETQKVIKAHPNFRIFATQNPTEGYGGRKELSEAFKNRFILINVHDVPLAELNEILIQKCQLPESRAKLMVDVMECLQIYRSQGSNLFSGKDSTITVRDLLKWANRMTEQSLTTTVHDLALEGYMALGERSRNEMDKKFIKETIERVCKVKIDEKQYYEDYFNTHLLTSFSDIHHQLNLPRLIQTQQLKRLAVLIHKCLKNKEPVLLVGETGCGKTTLCQIFAALDQQSLFSINCHQNTETSDFIGCMRTRKNLKKSQDQFMEGYQDLIHNLDNIIEDLVSYQPSQSLKSTIKAFQQLQKHIKSLPSVPEHILLMLKNLKTLQDDFSCIFEWHDGILVEAMQQGGLLLIDEISLANDSVLERLNSVFEHDRTLVISEKSSKEAVKIIGAEKFRMVATMNPSGDFGKKELSPALRNRMTEIWVESYFQQEDLLVIYRGTNIQMVHEVSSKVDLYLIIEETAFDKLSHKIPDKQAIRKLALSIFNIISYINFVLSAKYFSLQRKSLSIRDILSIIDFLQATIDNVFHFNLEIAFKHAVSLVIIDGLCLGIDVSGDKQKNEILELCNQYILQLDMKIFGNEVPSLIQYKESKFFENDQTIGVDPFQLEKKLTDLVAFNTYAFDAQTTKINLLKVLRAYQLNKPILIEGPPGVGKTSLVENLAKVSGRKLIRVNLSEQTDMMDLLGSEYPVSSNSQDGDDDIRFHWCDGVLLQAIKEGHWFLIDEMNLAQQSVLEGLNAILDHRRTVYIPELNQEFRCHPDFFVFACQNPSQSSTSVGGRKTLPKSFLNRFNKIYLEELTQQDYQVIIERQIHKTEGLLEENQLNVSALLDLSQFIELLIKSDTHSQHYSDEGDINMRDLSRFITLYRDFIVKDKVSASNSLLHAFRICYLQRLSLSKQEEALQMFYQAQSQLLKNSPQFNSRELMLSQVIRIDEINGTLNFLNNLKPSSLELTSTYHEQQNSAYDVKDFLALRGPHSTQLQFIVDCIKSGLSILAVTDQPQKLIENMQTIAKVVGQKINRILLNERSDTSQLLGCFEQTAADISAFMKQVSILEASSTDPVTLAQIQTLNSKMRDNLPLTQEDCPSSLQMPNLSKASTSSSFNWVDSVLVKSLIQGEWTVFENANLCNPSILDRLNPLLEEGNNSLSINEQGLIENEQLRVITAHPDFHALFVVSEHSLRDQGKDVSRALKNRCLQIHINYGSQNSQEKIPQQVISEEKVLDSQHMQIRWDLDIVRAQVLKSQVKARHEAHQLQGLGKRKKNEIVSEDVRDMLVSFKSIEEIATFFGQEEDDKLLEQNKVAAKAYLHYLVKFVGPQHAQVLLTYASQKYPKLNYLLTYLQAHSEIATDPWYNSYLPFMITNYLQKLQSLDFKRLIINKNTHAFLTYLVSGKFEGYSEELLVALRDIRRAIKSKDFNQILSYRNLYLMMKANALQATGEFLSIEGQSQIMQILNEQITSGEPLRIEEVTKYGSTQANNQSLVTKMQARLQELSQQPLQFCVRNITTNSSQIGLESLLLSFAILLMIEDKTITRITIDNHRQKLDPYLLQERMLTPYAILVPNSMDVKQYQADIIVSLSNLYTSLCLIKDTIKLMKQPQNLPFDRRLTQISPQLLGFKSKHAELIRLRGLQELESKFNSAKTEISMIEKALNASRSARMRDLPSYLLCSSLLQKNIKKYLALRSAQPVHVNLQSLLIQPDAETPYLTAYLKQLIETKTTSLLTATSPLIEEYRGSQGYKEALLQDYVLSKAVFPDIIVHLELCLKTLFLIPLETYRLTQKLSLERDHQASTEMFMRTQYRDEREVERAQKSIKEMQALIEVQIEQVKKVNQSGSEDKLKGLILAVKEIRAKFEELALMETHYDRETMKQSVKVLQAILNRAFDQYYMHFNHLLYPLFSVMHVFLTTLSAMLTPHNEGLQQLVDQIMCGKHQSKAETIALLRTKPANNKLLELYLSYQLVIQNNTKSTYDIKYLHTTVLDHFLHREVAKKLKEEQEQASLDELVYKLPFKMKMQTLMEDNKAYGERTKEDTEKMEKEALLEIERNFPSYYDEYQKVVFSGVSMEADEDFGKAKKKAEEVKVEKILSVMLNVDANLEKRKDAYKRSIVKLRLKMLQEIYEVNQSEGDLFIPFQERDSSWFHDLDNYLREELTQQTLPSVMNVTEVRLASTFNFYHDPLSHEARLVFEPLSKIIKRCDTILLEYESPILQDAIFLANYMLTNFSPKTAPLMKLLTGLELLLNKLEEWEVYASKSLNSCYNEMTLIKQLIIRYRKIQILSWRNLLQWRKTSMIHEDFRENFLRLAHTLERQIFDKQYYRQADNEKESVEMKILGVLDLFMRDSSLGQFKARLQFLYLIKQNFKYKFTLYFSQKQKTSRQYQRLEKTLNLLNFVTSYYSQFTGKLDSTLARLDAAAREKVKTLIDVSKWTVQKFEQVKNNIDKRHRQLNKACKDEEEMIMQNVAHLVLTSSRKKYVQKDDGLGSLEAEKSVLSILSTLDEETPVKFPRQPIELQPLAIIQKMSLIEKRMLEPKWPDCLSLENMISSLFERLKIVRDVNKKHIQRRAFIDLLKFMKEQGLQHNFQSSILPTFMDTSIVSFKKEALDNGEDFKKYYFKAHELLLMLENASEAENAASQHLRNLEIIRVRGFSQSLIMKILAMNKTICTIKGIYKELSSLNTEVQKSMVDLESRDLVLNLQNSKDFTVISSSFESFQATLKHNLQILALVDNSTAQPLSFPAYTKAKILTPTSLSTLLTQMQVLFDTLSASCITQPPRVQDLINQQALPYLTALIGRANEIERQDTTNTVQTDKLAQRVTAMQRLCQLMVQETVQVMEERYQQQAKEKEEMRNLTNLESTQGESVGQAANAEDERIELNIKEYAEFAQKVVDQSIGKYGQEIKERAYKVFRYAAIKEGVLPSQVKEELQLAAQLLQRVTGLVKFIMESQYLYMRSLAKFSFISQRIFIYLIFEGFCGEDDKEEDKNDKEQQDEDDKFFENDGMGMGDGKGGKENVSKEIEHEEQLEGLKNYESDQEKPPEDKEENKDEKKDEENNDFEMQGDFDGDMEDKPDEDGEDKEEKEDEKSDEDDELDQVDDMLDNKLWNEQMQDMEDREQEEDQQEDDKKEPPREVDLGERDLDQENQVPQEKKDKEMTAGDNDKQEEKDSKEKDEDDKNQGEEEKRPDEEPDNQEEEDNQEEMKDEEENGNDIPLDRDPNVVEELKEEEKKPEEEEDQDMDGDDEKSVSANADDEEQEGAEDSEAEDSKSQEGSDAHNDQDLQSEASNEENEDEGYKRDVNSDVAEDEQMLNEEEQQEKKDMQTNVKKPKNSANQNKEEQSKQQNQSNNNMDQQTQFDVTGSDILYQLSNKLKERQQQQNNNPKNTGDEQQKPEKKNEQFKEIDQPNMNPEQDDNQAAAEDQDRQDAEGDHAMEYEYDKNQVEQLQGRLATDQVQEATQLQVPDEQQDDQLMQEEEKDDIIKPLDKTQAEAREESKHSKQRATEVKQQDVEELGQDDGDQQANPDQIQQRIEEMQLIDQYSDYLAKRDQINLQVSHTQEAAQVQPPLYTFQSDLNEPFDYLQSRTRIRQLYAEWQAKTDLVAQSQQMLSKFKQETANSAASLCEQLRIVLEPQLSQQLQGDFKTGKRLNMKKVISFIASHYRNDKIWLRRTLPSKRDYKILLAIDDTLSMKEGGLGFFSLEALATISEALHRLEVGKVAVAAIRDRMELLQSFEEGASQSNERTAFVMSQFNFQHSAPKSADQAMANFVKDANQLLDSQSLGANDALSLPFVIILSDGRFNKNNVRQYLSEAREKKYLYIFVILDSVSKKGGQQQALTEGSKKKASTSDGSILSMKSVEKEESGGIKLVPYLKDFPFDYYCIVRDVHQLPTALGSILVQWFSMVNGGGSQ